MKTRIIYIANARIPTEKAHGIQIMKMCESLAGLADIELVIPRRFNRIKESPFDYYGIPEVFKIKRLPCLDLVPLDKYLGHLGLWVESVTFAFFVFWFIIFKKLDIFYTRDKFLLPLVFFRKNLVFEAHTLPKNFFLYSFFLKRLKGIVVITQKLKGSFLEKGIPNDKILVAPDGVDIEMFNIQDSKSEARKKLDLPQDKKIVLYTGHLYKWKGAQTLADASRYLPADVEVYFVGGTGEDVEKFSAQGGSASGGKVNVVGHRPYSEIPYWLRAADVLVLPNSGREEISRHWTSPMKMFEYMAAQRPIIASDLPSLREVLNKKNEKENAFLVKPDDAVALAQGIKEVLENSELANRLSNQAFQDVQEYSWAKRVEKILTFVKL